MYSGLHTKIGTQRSLFYITSSFTFVPRRQFFEFIDISCLAFVQTGNSDICINPGICFCHLNNCEYSVLACAFRVSENSQFLTYRHRANTVLAGIITETATTVFKIGHQELSRLRIYVIAFKFAITARIHLFQPRQKPSITGFSSLRRRVYICL